MSDMISTETILAKKTTKKEKAKLINDDLEKQQNELQDSMREKKAGKRNNKMKLIEAKAKKSEEEQHDMIEQKANQKSKALNAIEKQMKRAEKKALQEKPILFFSVSRPIWLEF